MRETPGSSSSRYTKLFPLLENFVSAIIQPLHSVVRVLFSHPSLLRVVPIYWNTSRNMVAPLPNQLLELVLALDTTIGEYPASRVLESYQAVRCGQHSPHSRKKCSESRAPTSLGVGVEGKSDYTLNQLTRMMS